MKTHSQALGIIHFEGGWNALMLAIKENNMEAVQALIEKGASPWIKNQHQDNAWDVATSWERDSIEDSMEAFFLKKKLTAVVDNPVHNPQKAMRL